MSDGEPVCDGDWLGLQDCDGDPEILGVADACCEGDPDSEPETDGVRVPLGVFVMLCVGDIVFVPDPLVDPV